MKEHAPWWLKVGAKIVMARLPLSYSLWQKAGLFRHGRMDTSRYLLGVFNAHVRRAGFENALAGRTILELGPGDSIGTAMVGAAHWARTMLVDTGAYATTDMAVYRKLASALEAEGLAPPDLSSVETLNGVLAQSNACYLTTGLDGMREIASGSVDLIFSQAVLEHVRKDEFAELMVECRRVLASGGVASHRVDLKDHLGGSLNNLRFSERLWESGLMANSGFYTNRMRFGEMLTLFRQAGFSVEVLNVKSWEQLPLARRKMDAAFASLPEEELTVSGFDVVLRPDG